MSGPPTTRSRSRQPTAPAPAPAHPTRRRSSTSSRAWPEESLLEAIGPYLFRQVSPNEFASKRFPEDFPMLETYAHLYRADFRKVLKVISLYTAAEMDRGWMTPTPVGILAYVLGVRDMDLFTTWLGRIPRSSRSHLPSSQTDGLSQSTIGDRRSGTGRGRVHPTGITLSRSVRASTATGRQPQAQPYQGTTAVSKIRPVTAVGARATGTTTLGRGFVGGGRRMVEGMLVFANKH